MCNKAAQPSLARPPTHAAPSYIDTILTVVGYGRVRCSVSVTEVTGHQSSIISNNQPTVCADERSEEGYRLRFRHGPRFKLQTASNELFETLGSDISLARKIRRVLTRSVEITVINGGTTAPVKTAPGLYYLKNSTYDNKRAKRAAIRNSRFGCFEHHARESESKKKRTQVNWGGINNAE
jgi:hypothetical protein